MKLKVKTGPKILFLDIETAPMFAAVWGLWKQNIGINMIDVDWHMLSFSAKWEGSNKTFYFDKKKSWDTEDDRLILEALFVLLDEADIVVAHNGRKFDLPKINTRFIMNGMKAPSPYRIVDTLDICKKHFRFSSNKLEYVAKALGVGEKFMHKEFPGYELWKQCLAGNKDAWREMKVYNIQDTIVLEQVYDKLRPWHNIHPNHGVYVDSNNHKHTCSKCGSDDLRNKGYYYTQVAKYQKFVCNSCGGYSRTRKTEITKDKRQSLLTSI